MIRLHTGLALTTLALIPLATGCKVARLATRVAQETTQSANTRSTPSNTNGQGDIYTFTGVLEEGDTRREDDNSFQDIVNISLKTGQVVTITMKPTGSTSFDTYLLVSTPDGEEAGQNDDCTDGKPELGSCVTFVATTAGNYRILANGYSETDAGPYEVVVHAR